LGNRTSGRSAKKKKEEERELRKPGQTSVLVVEEGKTKGAGVSFLYGNDRKNVNGRKS